MRSICFVFILVISSHAVFAQKVNDLTDKDLLQLKHYSLLSDRAYTFRQILSDSTLPFIPNDSIRSEREAVYWLKMIVANPLRSAVQYNIRLNPYLDNTWYYFDAGTQKWISKSTGIRTVRYNERRNNWYFPFTAERQTVNTLYVKIHMRALAASHHLKPVITFEKKSSATGKEQMLWVGWICGLSVLFLFFLNNLYIYIV